MTLLRKFKSSTLLVLAFGFLFVASVSSCGGKKEGEESTEQIESAEHPAEEAEHPTEGAEHPTDSTSEHPADTTATN
ncbi:hypothetical protein MMU07_11405 [Aquiflexum sp. LQ15W]|uniref:hypothetical protein n=1 Tax=Cognataquiflexum nitidum TaxID=2922272 RepID=UPI001F136DE9|nr:hypothetical protein [Cognataquiflexum nitidum]MCH6200193.1 hypothetical protein [Cognataquiflexum nitidum]